MARRPILLIVALTAIACAGNEAPLPLTPPTAPPSPVVVGGRWEAAAPFADAGPRPSDPCAPSRGCLVPYLPAHPRLAMNKRGEAVAAWQRFEGGAYRLYATRFDPERGWAAEEAIAAVPPADDVRVAIDGAGASLIVHRHEADLESSSGVPGRPWTMPRAIACGYQPDLAMDDVGRGHLVFVQPGVAVVAMFFAAGDWTAPQVLQSSAGESEASAIGVSVAQDGSAIASWIRGDVGNQDDGDVPWSMIWSSRRRGGQAWSAAERAGVLDQAFSFDLDVLATDGGGGALAYGVFGSSDAAYRWAVWGQHTVGGGLTWLPPEHLSAPPAPTTILKRFPRFAAGGRGDALLTWVDQEELRGPDSRSDIRARWYSPARGAWSETSTVAGDPASRAPRFDVASAMSWAGNAVVAWKERFDNERQRLMASHYVPGTGWSAPETIRVGRMSPPQIVMDARGHALLAWSEWGDDRLRVWSARLTPTTR